MGQNRIWCVCVCVGLKICEHIVLDSLGCCPERVFIRLRENAGSPKYQKASFSLVARCGVQPQPERDGILTPSNSHTSRTYVKEKKNWYGETHLSVSDRVGRTQKVY